MALEAVGLEDGANLGLVAEVAVGNTPACGGGAGETQNQRECKPLGSVHGWPSGGRVGPCRAGGRPTLVSLDYSRKVRTRMQANPAQHHTRSVHSSATRLRVLDL